MNEKTKFKYYLASMMRYIRAIDKTIGRAGSLEAALTDEVYFHALTSCVIQLGEHAGLISKLKSIEYNQESFPAIEWYGMRCKMVHNYGGIDLSALKEAIVDDLPQLERFIREEVMEEVIKQPGILLAVEYEDLEKKTVNGLLANATPRSEQTIHNAKTLDHGFSK